MTWTVQAQTPAALLASRQLSQLPRYAGVFCNTYRTNSYVVKETQNKTIVSSETSDGATCLPIPELSDINCSPFTCQCYQRRLCEASISKVISPDDWLTAHSVQAHCNEFIILGMDALHSFEHVGSVSANIEYL